ncbi:hypothetical protein DPQ33_18085 [Oceanidesulfovibrio indonesiensis]|uniref:Uncharacterized protein n=1 Tax=Oceanidesulfovibrio indonesiensis TaxID=54767 RepID=A0A7M3MAF2_9BACT|nr:hypothetical protein [Oceanidesulfovibrio indonesiensis]TVM13813.1 hypothetical protein DPQ33_18085 [Oceanidesulfovibrio indonesiensis]
MASHLLWQLRSIIPDGNTPLARRFAGAVYRACASTLRRKKYGRDRVEIESGVGFQELGDTGYHTFFGYYDVTPFDNDGQTVLAMRRPSTPTSHAAGTPIELGTYDLLEPAPVFKPFARSTAWCWQMGCRLQWLGGGRHGLALFNDTREGKHVAVLVHASTGQEQSILPRPVYSITRDGERFVSLNFPRLQRLRPGYGYDDLPDATEQEAAPRDDGLWLCDIATGREQLILSLADAARYKPQPSMDGATHYFNHVLWNPSGERFFFIHLWKDRSGKRHGRGLVWDCTQQRILDLGIERHTSHYCWVDDDSLVVFSTHQKTGMRYHSYTLPEGMTGVVGEGILTEDGHPTPRPGNERLILTDTYPDRLREQTLMLFDMDSNELRRLGSFYSPFTFTGEQRCDLHPRWSPTGDRICIDSPHAGERRMCILTP